MTEDRRLDQIMAIMEAAFDPHWREAWTRQQVASSLILPHTRAILVDSDGQPIDERGEAAGFVLSRRAADEEELLLIAVHPAHRERGVGRTLLELFETTSREAGVNSVFLEMRDANPAERLYRQSGFSPIGRRTNYYRTLDGSTVDAITFAKQL